MWKLDSQPVTLLGGDRTLKAGPTPRELGPWGCGLQEILTHSLSLSFSLSLIPVSVLWQWWGRQVSSVTRFCEMTLSPAQKQQGQQSWTKASKTMSPNKLSSLVSIFLIFCHTDRKLTDTPRDNHISVICSSYFFFCFFFSFFFYFLLSWDRVWLHCSGWPQVAHLPAFPHPLPSVGIIEAPIILPGSFYIFMTDKEIWVRYKIE